jgi:hypothetical protein
MQKLSDIDLIVQYILDCEYEDFKENASDNHIYFTALKVAYGETEARDILNETLNKVE